MESVRRWIEEAPYSRALGARVESLDAASVRLALAYRDENANPGRALHGGVAASLSAIGGQALARIALGPDSGPWHTCALQVGYLAAAVGEDVVADSRLLRRGKELCFAEVDVATRDGKPIAHATVAVRGRFGAAEPSRSPVPADHGESDPGKMGPHIARLPFIAKRGIHVEHMAARTSRLRMPCAEANADAAGGVHEGAVLALLDTTGAMAAWADCGPGPFKASTPAIQAQITAPPPAADLVAFGRSVQRDGDIYFCSVDVATSRERLLVARGTVLYRIVSGP